MPTLTLNLNNTPDNLAFEVECPNYAQLGCSSQGGYLRCRNCGYDKGWNLDTGARMVRLVGSVENIIVHPVSGDYVSGLEAWIIFNGKQYCNTDAHFPEVFSSAAHEVFPIYPVMAELIRNIIEAYQNNTLPAAIRERLEEVADNA